MGAVFLATLLMAFAAPAPAAGKCKVAKMAELPVTMVGRRPMIDAKFGDRSARFIVDSGAFYSTISSASAAEFGLKVTPLPPTFRMRGIGGDSSVGVAKSTDFSLSGIKLPYTNFIVGGSDTG
ncbi:MAG: retropepsin-like domain-containing protein, partial [Proteobacteria bacterium]|nr:retropepsin-like domain-containing protein [Pseudomonadota bacterium]